MSISNILHMAYTGLSASQTVMRSISNNVANVNTEGYGRETVSLQALAYGANNGGVQVAAIRRVTDKFLESAVYAANGDAGQYDKMAEFHSRLQGLIGSPDSNSGLAARLNDITSAIADVTADPADAVRRRAVIDSVQSMTDEISRISSDIQQLRADASNQIVETVTTINSLLERIHSLNPLIVRENMISGNSGGLQEQRAQALQQLSQLIDIRTEEADDGSVQVATTTGVVLVDQTLRQLEYLSPGSAAPETNFSQIKIYNLDPRTNQKVDTGTVLDGDIRSGRLKGLLTLRDQQLPALAEELGELARQFTEQINAIHNASTAVPPANALTGRQTSLATSDPLHFTGVSTFAVVDANGVIVAKSTVDFDALGSGTPISALLAQVNADLGGAGTLSLTNGQLSFTATNSGNGVVIADDETNPSDRGGRGFSHFFGMNDLIVADQTSNYNTGVQGSDAHGFTLGGTTYMQVRDASNRLVGDYTLTVAGATFDDLLTQLNDPAGMGRFMTFSLDAEGQLISTPKPGYENADIRVVSDTTNRAGTGTTISSFFGVGHSVKASAVTGLGVRDDIISDPYKLSLAKLDTGAAIGETALGTGDQRGAAALRDFANAAFTFEAAGNIATLSGTLSQYLGFVLGDSAIMASQASASSDDAKALLSNVTKRRDDYSGVNLDEELSNMLIYQNSYSAAARLMTTARDMYDTLLTVIQ